MQALESMRDGRKVVAAGLEARATQVDTVLGGAGQEAYSTEIWADLGRVAIGRAAERRLDSRTLHR